MTRFYFHAKDERDEADFVIIIRLFNFHFKVLTI